VRLQLHALAYNLGNFLRTLATPEPIGAAIAAARRRAGLSQVDVASQFHDWQVYGEFASEQAFRNELPNIRAQGLYTRRRPTQSLAPQPTRRENDR